MFKEHSVVYDDGTEEPIDAVIMGTGYSFDYPFLNPKSLIPVKVGVFQKAHALS